MARLLIKTAGLENRTLELRLGVNHVGRDPDCDFAAIGDEQPFEHGSPLASGLKCPVLDARGTALYGRHRRRGHAN